MPAPVLDIGMRCPADGPKDGRPWGPGQGCNRNFCNGLRRSIAFGTDFPYGLCMKNEHEGECSGVRSQGTGQDGGGVVGSWVGSGRTFFHVWTYHRARRPG